MEKEQKILGVHRNVFFLGLVSLLNDFSSEMAQSVMPVFLTSVLGAPVIFLGFLEGMAEALSSVLKFASGFFSDRAGKRGGQAAAGYALAGAARIFYAFSTNIWQIFTLRLTDRVGKGIRAAPRDALIAESVSSSDRAHSFNFHRGMDTVGGALGPITAFFLLPFLGGQYPIFFIIAASLGFLSLIPFLFIREAKMAMPANPSTRREFNWRIVFANRPLRRAMGALFVFGLGALPLGLVVLKGKELGFGAAGVPLAYFIYSVAFVLAAIPLGRIADRAGSRLVIIFGFLAAILGYGFFAHMAGEIWLILFFAILGIAGAATDGVSSAFTAELSKGTLVGSGQGFLQMTIGFSALFAGVIGGYLWTVHSAGLAFSYAAALSLIGLFLFIIITRHTPSPLKNS